LRQTTRTLPIVFAGVSDPVGAGLVGSLARPDGNITGFALPEYGISVKWLELLKELAPQARCCRLIAPCSSHLPLDTAYLLFIPFDLT
jgi:putative ABC transport system substrate-binding protein